MAICLRNFTIAMLILLASSSQAQELLKVPVAIPAVRPAATTFVVARDRRYYREEGLDVELIVMPSAIGTQALIGGNVKFSTVGGAGLLPYPPRRATPFPIRHIQSPYVLALLQVGYPLDERPQR